MLRAHLYADPEPLPAMPELPGEVARLCERCLAKDPTARPTSAEVASTLATAVGLSVAPVSPAPVASADLGLDSVAGTTILPWSVATGALAGAARRTTLPDRVRMAMAAVGVVGITGLVWAMTGGSAATGNRGPEGSQRMGMALQQAAACHVSYALRADTGRAFLADLTLTNRADKPAEDWELIFDVPDDQQISAGRSAAVDQEGQRVVVRPAAGAVRLAPGGSAVLGLSGTYAGSNSLPVRFELDGAPCDVQVSGLAVSPTASRKPPAAVPVSAERAGPRVSGSASGKGAGKERAGGKGSGKRGGGDDGRG
jgi:eukaryotic-like serine/threonine-protein kinase